MHTSTTRQVIQMAKHFTAEFKLEAAYAYRRDLYCIGANIAAGDEKQLQ